MATSAENLTLSIVRESVIGTTPVDPVWQKTGVVSESLIVEPTFTESEMMAGGTRGVTDTVLTQLATSGDINRELIYENATDMLLESLLGNTFGNDPHANGTDATQLYDYIQLLPLSIEKDWNLDGVDHNYHRYVGQVPTSGSIEFAPGEIITHTTSFVGLGMSTEDAEIANSTYEDPSGNSPMAAPRVTSMTLTTTGTENPVAWMNAACFTQLNLSFENNTRALACIGSLSSREIALGRLNVTASGSLYYAADDPIDSMLMETEYGLVIEAEDLAGNSYKFFIPRVKFTVANVNATGQSTDVMTEFTLQALEYPATDYTIIITKTDFVP